MTKIFREIFRGMRFSDYLFILVLLANLILVTYLGIGDYQKGVKVDQSLRNGEQILSWFENFSQKIEANETVTQSACLPLAEGERPIKGAKVNTWHSCVENLFSSSGPFRDYSNLLNPKSLPYVEKCDKHDVGSSGAFVFEKLTLNPAGPPATSPMGPGEKLVSGMNFRLSLCDTGYYLVKIGEFKL